MRITKAYAAFASGDLVGCLLQGLNGTDWEVQSVSVDDDCTVTKLALTGMAPDTSHVHASVTVRVAHKEDHA